MILVNIAFLINILFGVGAGHVATREADKKICAEAEAKNEKCSDHLR